MNSPQFMIAGDVEIPKKVTRINLLTPLSRYDFVTIVIDEDEETLLVSRVAPEELAIFEGAPLFQADSGEDENSVILRQVSLAYWPFDEDEQEDDEDDEDEASEEVSELAEDDEVEADDAESKERGFTVVSPRWWTEFTRKHRRG